MQTHTRPKGFGLIEMAIIMIIVGVVLATVLPRILAPIATDKAKQAIFELRTVRDEILGYAAIHGDLPAPDTAPGYPVVPASDISHHLDAWGQPIRYIVAQDANGDSLDAVNANSAVSPTRLAVELHPNSATATALKQTSNVAFIVYSSGADQTKQVADADAIDGDGTFVHYPHGADLDGNPATAGEYDDLVEFATLDYLQTKAADSGPTPTPGGSPTGDIDFSDMNADFPAAGSIMSEGGTVVVDAAAGTLTLTNPTGGGGSAGGCIWYQGSSGNCTADDAGYNGACDLGDGFRAFFTYTINTSPAPDGGFTFAIPAVKLDGTSGTAASNDDMSALCGGFTNLQYMGYAGTAIGNSIDEPKLGVEFDLLRQTAANDPGPDHQNSKRNHLGVDFWALTRANDTTHGVGLNPADSGSNTAPDTDGVYYDSTDNWLENLAATGADFRMEYEVVDKDNGEVKVRVWDDCDTATWPDCRDLSQDLSAMTGPDPTIEYSLTDPSLATAGGKPFERHRIGWTFAFDSNNELATFTDFGLTWR